MTEVIKDGEEIDTCYADEVVCPHCGIVYADSMEFFEKRQEDVDITCDACGKHFRASINYDISYTSHKVGE